MSTFSHEIQSTSFKTKPTILQVIPSLGVGGVEVETIEIGKAIASAGGRSLVAANVSKWFNDALPNEIEFINLPLDTKNPLRISKNGDLLKNLIIKENVDIVHVRSRAPAWSAYKAAKSLKIPFITTHHAAYHSKSIFKTFYNSVMARGDRVIAISQFMADHIVNEYKHTSWFDPSKIRLIHRGVDCHFFDPSTISHERLDHLRQKWGIQSDNKLIILPGRLSRSKGHEISIEALSLMNHSDVTLVFVGSTQGHESLKKTLLHKISALDLEGRVKWMPPCQDLPAAYQLANMIILPSIVPEGFGRVIVEAQSMKKPIIATNIGAPRELIEEGITGWLTPPGDALALAKTIDLVFNLPNDQLEKNGDLGRKRALTHFSKEIMCSETVDVYKEILDI